MGWRVVCSGQDSEVPWDIHYAGVHDFLSITKRLRPLSSRRLLLWERVKDYA